MSLCTRGSVDLKVTAPALGHAILNPHRAPWLRRHRYCFLFPPAFAVGVVEALREAHVAAPPRPVGWRVAPAVSDGWLRTRVEQPLAHGLVARDGGHVERRHAVVQLRASIHRGDGVVAALDDEVDAAQVTHEGGRVQCRAAGRVGEEGGEVRRLAAQAPERLPSSLAQRSSLDRGPRLEGAQEQRVDALGYVEGDKRHRDCM